MPSLPVQFHHLQLRFLDEGPLLPWLGPALRGMLAGGFKEQVCGHPPQVRLQQWERCDGCPWQDACPYAVLFEPAGSGLPAREDAARRPLVVAPGPSPAAVARPGMCVPMRVMVAGETAEARALDLLRTLEELGIHRGLGADGVRFELEPTGDPTRLELNAGMFPPCPVEGEAVIPRLEVELTAPLFLRKSMGKNLLRAPTLADLARASIRLVGDLMRQLAGENVDADVRALEDAADLVATVEPLWECFRQPHLSTRGRTRYPLEGAVGGAVFQDVPVSLVPWITWGGMLHVGSHRVAGAGGWRTILG